MQIIQQSKNIDKVMVTKDDVSCFITLYHVVTETTHWLEGYLDNEDGKYLPIIGEDCKHYQLAYFEYGDLRLYATMFPADKIPELFRIRYSEMILMEKL